MTLHGIDLDSEAIREFCRKWRICGPDVFGSILRADFRPDSDVDFLVTFEDEANWDVTDLDTMELSLARILGRKVELIERQTVVTSPNYIRRNHILKSATPIYAH